MELSQKLKELRKKQVRHRLRLGRKAVCVQAGHIWMGSRNVEAIDREPAEPVLAEPGALIGFAGPRVIEQTIGEKLPAGFQRSEFQMEHGFVDQVVPRSQLRDTLIQVLQLHAGGKHE